MSGAQNAGGRDNDQDRGDLVNIRPAIKDDVARLLEIRFDAFAAQDFHDYSAREYKVLIQDVDLQELRAMIQAQCLFVAQEDDETICGLAGWYDGALRHVYIDPAYQGQAIARQLIDKAETDYNERTGNRTIATGAISYARPFYEKMGYSVVERGRDWDGSFFYRMQKVR